APFALFFPAVAAIAWAFGVGPTLLAIALSAGLGWWLIVPDTAIARATTISAYVVSTGGLVILARLAAATRRSLVLALDESERAHVERARLATIVSSSDDAIISKDLNGTILSWNNGAERLFGYRSEEILGHSVLRLIPDERRPEEEHILRRMRQGERIEHFETVRVAKDGRRLDVSLSVSPIRNVAGEIVGASKIARDVTERKRTERAVAEQRELLRATLSSIGDAVVTTDAAGIITYMNPVAARLSGYSRDEACGAPIGSIIRMRREDDHQPVQDVFDKLVRGAAGLDPEPGSLLVGRDGREVPVEERATLILDAANQPNGMVLVFHDVAERRHAELQRQVAEREREQLLQSERAARGEAERANRLKDQFLATVSHELRTPLNAILGWADLLRRNDGDKEALARGLRVIERNARIQAQLVSDLLDVSRIVSGKLKLELSLVNLQSVVEQALDTVRASADAKQLQVERWIEPGLESIVGDADRLQQVVWNLLSNAVKFTPQGGTLSLRVERVGQQAQITVRDNGAGVAPEFLPHLFDRFRQADAS
ncbi:MAG TPA: PAS domain S-box protein, partial [Polyangiales bacterium]